MHACMYIVCHDVHVDVRGHNKSGELVLSFYHVIPGDDSGHQAWRQISVIH